MKKLGAKKLTLLAGVVFIIVVSMIIWVVLKPQPTVVGIGETLKLNSNEPIGLKDKLLNYYAGLGFDGTMELTVSTATLYDSYFAVGLKKEDIRGEISDFQGLSFLLLDCRLKNENAAALTPEDKDFNISLLSLCQKQRFDGYNTLGGGASSSERLTYSSEANYFSLYQKKMEKGSATDPYFHYNLKQGETMNFELGFFVKKEDYENKNYILNIGNSSMYKYGVALTGETK